MKRDVKKEVKKVMHLISSGFYGGPEKQILEQGLRIDRNAFEVIVAAFTERSAPHSKDFLLRAKSVGLGTLEIPTLGALDFRPVALLRRWIKDFDISLLCGHGYKSVMIGWSAARSVRVPVIAFSRGYTTEDLKVACYEWLERRLLNWVDGIVAVSEGQAERLRSMGVKNRNIWVVQNAVSTRELSKLGCEKLRKDVLKRLNIQENAKIVVSAGRLSQEKGQLFLIEAINRMKQWNKDTFFVFCGDGLQRGKLESRATELGVHDQCRFVGFRDDLEDIFQAMELLVLPSLTEGLPNVVLEAFACGKPVVASGVGGVPEVVENGANGILVPPGDAAALAEAIEECLEDPAMMRRMGKAGHGRVKSEFTFEEQTRKFEELYSKVLWK